MLCGIVQSPGERREVWCEGMGVKYLKRTRGYVIAYGYTAALCLKFRIRINI